MMRQQLKTAIMVFVVATLVFTGVAVSVQHVSAATGGVADRGSGGTDAVAGVATAAMGTAAAATGMCMPLVTICDWKLVIEPALKKMAEQLTAVAMQQTQIFGSFLDAEAHLEARRSLQEIEAHAHKDYQPSVGMCEFGSNVKSLAASEEKTAATAVILSQRSLDRQLGNAYTSAGGGDARDKENRIQQFRKTYCDVRDNASGLTDLCTHNEGIGAMDVTRVNKDIDFVRTIDAPWTLDVDFTDSGKTATPDEEDLFALASNLYAYNILARPSENALRPGKDKKGLTAMQEAYLDARSLIAKRSVAENSFNAITAMKAAGSGGSREFMIGIMEDLGVQDGEALKLLGQSPSYYAQMEVLTKKIYQSPQFYTNLYDKPANVERKGVALQALALMQKFDAFKSHLRSEASLSVLLELAVMDLQDKAEEQKGGNTATEAYSQE